MTKADRFNIASDLRRIANWMARRQKEKLPLILRLWGDAKSHKEVSKVIRHFVENINPDEAFKKEKRRLFFAEQVLISSIRLQSQAA